MGEDKERTTMTENTMTTRTTRTTKVTTTITEAMNVTVASNEQMLPSHVAANNSRGCGGGKG